jgi:hypothetical protein
MLLRKVATAFGGFMDRATILKDLGQAKARVVVGEQDIALQKQFIGDLIREGHAARARGADEFLHALEIAQALGVTHRDYLEKELSTRNAV